MSCTVEFDHGQRQPERASNELNYPELIEGRRKIDVLRSGCEELPPREPLKFVVVPLQAVPFEIHTNGEPPRSGTIIDREILILAGQLADLKPDTSAVGIDDSARLIEISMNIRDLVIEKRSMNSTLRETSVVQKV